MNRPRGLGVSGKMATIAITGATSGIGQAAAVALASGGHRILLIGRDPDRGAAALAQVQLAGAEGHQLYLADLSLVREARRLAAEIARDHPRLDVLANNAGAILPRREETAEGVERTFAIDHLGAWTLTDALLPMLRESGARVVTTSSAAHWFARLDAEDWQLRRGWTSWRAYNNAKLMNVLMTTALRKREPRLTALSFHPGFVRSRFGTRPEGLAGLMGVAQRLVGRSNERGAETLVHLATAPLPPDPAIYWADRRPARTSRRATDAALADRLWAESARLAGPVAASS